MEWNVEKIPNSERFTMTSQTRDALHRTLLCHTAFIEVLLLEGYRYDASIPKNDDIYIYIYSQWPVIIKYLLM